MICPLCSVELESDTVKCPACGADLTEFICACYQPDLLFNDALTCIEREKYGDACSLLCRAFAMRPDDPELLLLWARSEYLAGNKKRAVELMADLTEIDASPEYMALFDELVAEYDREQVSSTDDEKPEPAAQLTEDITTKAVIQDKEEKNAQSPVRLENRMKEFARMAGIISGDKQ